MRMGIDMSGPGRFFFAEDGVSSVEYSLVAMLVALAILTGVMALGASVRRVCESVVNKWPAVAAA